MVKRFSLGKILITPTAAEAIPKYEILVALRRHLRGDWGDLTMRDRHANTNALLNGKRLFSAYHSGEGIKFWIITEADRSATTVLLPEDY